MGSPAGTLAPLTRSSGNVGAIDTLAAARFVPIGRLASGVMKTGCGGWRACQAGRLAGCVRVATADEPDVLSLADIVGLRLAASVRLARKSGA